MKRYISVILIAIICFGLYVTNPTREDFKIFCEEVLRKELTSERNIATNLLSGVVASITGKLASSMATRDDYYLFSIYSLQMEEEEIKFIGILNRFLPLKLPKELASEPEA